MTGPELRKAREARGLSRFELAEKAEVGYSTLADLEEGRRRTQPRILRRVLTALAAAPVLPTLSTPGATEVKP